MGDSVLGGDFNADGVPDLLVASSPDYDPGWLDVYHGPLVSGLAPSHTMIDTVHNPFITGAADLRRFPSVAYGEVVVCPSGFADTYVIPVGVLTPPNNDVSLVGIHVLGAQGGAGVHAAAIGGEHVFSIQGNNETYLVSTDLTVPGRVRDVARITVDSVPAWFDPSHRSSDLGDLDGDGVADLAIGESYGVDFGGRVDVITGIDTVGAYYVKETDAVVTIEGDPQLPTEWIGGEGFGWALEIVPDGDGDGYGELLVGAPSAGWSPEYEGGGAYLWRGLPAPGSLPESADWRVAGWDDWALGTTLASLGDVDGDGLGDLAVADPGPSGNQVNVYYGPHEGYVGSLSYDVTIVGTFGWLLADSLASGGDYDGDGLNDLIVGDRLRSPMYPGPSVGAALIFGSMGF